MSRDNGDEHEDDNSDDDNDEDPHREEEPEEWKLLCHLNKRCDDTISQGSQSHENLQFYWTETARAMPLHLLRKSANWITKQRNDAIENATILNKRQQKTVDPAQLNTQQMLLIKALLGDTCILTGTTGLIGCTLQ